MDLKTKAEFDFSPNLITRFNLWRQTLMDAVPEADREAVSPEPGYRPYLLPRVLESVIIGQMGWMTAWRIGRYARNSLLVQPFYTRAPQLPPEGLRKEKEAYDTRCRKIRDERSSVDRRQPGWQDNISQGIPDYDPTNAQVQLREAAREFEHDYRNWYRDINGSVEERTKQILLDVIPKAPVYLLNGDDEKAEYQQMRNDGDYRYIRLFTDSLGTGIRTHPGAELLAFYDEYIHDSRAWFMQSSVGGREPWGGYFRYRMIYFGDIANKQLRLISVSGRVVGAAPTSNRVAYSVEMREEAGEVREIHRVTDLASGQVQTLSPAAMLPASNLPLQTAARQQSQIAAAEHQARRELAAERLQQAGARIIS